MSQIQKLSTGLETPVSVANGGTGISSYTQGDLLYSDATDSLAKLSISTEPAETLMTDGTDVRWKSARDTIYIHDDFIGNWDNTYTFGPFGWRRQAQSGGGIEAADGDLASTNPGLLRFKTGTSTGWGGVGLDNVLDFGSGVTILEFVVKALNVGDGTNDFSLFLGFGDRYFSATAEPANGAYFAYNQGTNSGNWVGKTANASTFTSANSSVALDTNFNRFTIIVNSAGTSIAYYINGTEIDNSPITTNIPTQTGIQFGIAHVAGAERKCLIDYVLYKKILTTAR